MKKRKGCDLNKHQIQGEHGDDRNDEVEKVEEKEKKLQYEKYSGKIQNMLIMVVGFYNIERKRSKMVRRREIIDSKNLVEE